MAEVATACSRGCLGVAMDRQPGQRAATTAAMDGIRDNLGAVNAAILELSNAAAAGDFARRGDAARFEFAFRGMVESLNTLMARAEGGLNDVGAMLGRGREADRGSDRRQFDPGPHGQPDGRPSRRGDGRDVEAVRRVNDIMGEISAAGTEQSAGIQQVSDTVGQMDQVTQQNAALVEEATAAARAGGAGRGHGPRGVGVPRRRSAGAGGGRVADAGGLNTCDARVPLPAGGTRRALCHAARRRRRNPGRRGADCGGDSRLRHGTGLEGPRVCLARMGSTP
jgi:hypothetical protein